MGHSSLARILKYYNRRTIILIHYNEAVVFDLPSSVIGKADCELRLEVRLHGIIWEYMFVFFFCHSNWLLCQWVMML
jgi:hypothetical protein